MPEALQLACALLHRHLRSRCHMRQYLEVALAFASARIPAYAASIIKTSVWLRTAPRVARVRRCHRPLHHAHTANSRSTAPAPSQKSRDNKPLGNLFEDLESVELPKLKSEVKGNLPVVKKPGSWDSENGNGMPPSRRMANAAALTFYS